MDIKYLLNNEPLASSPNTDKGCTSMQSERERLHYSQNFGPPDLRFSNQTMHSDTHYEHSPVYSIPPTNTYQQIKMEPNPLDAAPERPYPPPRRVQLSKECAEYLRDEFNINKFPDTLERERLGEILGMPAKKIQSN